MAARFNDLGLRAILKGLIFCAVLLTAKTSAQLLPPIITVQPLSMRVQNGDTVNFSTAVISLTTPSFKWLYNGQPISTNANVSVLDLPLLGISTLTLYNVSPANAGTYCVKVSNGIGAPATSENAILSVVGGIRVDTVTWTNSGSDGYASLTWPHSVGLGANRFLLVNVSTHSCSVLSVTYGGVGLTQLVATTNASGSAVRTGMWYLKSPATGTANIVVTLTGKDAFDAGAISLCGVNQAQPFDAVTNATGTAFAPMIIVTAAAGDVAVDSVVVHAATYGTPGNAQTSLWKQHTGKTGSDVWGSSSFEAGATNVTMSWITSGSSGAGEWASAAAALRPADDTVLLPVASALTPAGFSFQLSAPLGSQLVIEASSDLVHWIPIATNSAPDGTVSCTDPAALNFPGRYYRARIE